MVVQRKATDMSKCQKQKTSGEIDVMEFVPVRTPKGLQEYAWPVKGHLKVEGKIFRDIS